MIIRVGILKRKLITRQNQQVKRRSTKNPKKHTILKNE